jgi:hypothetical protein
MQNRMFVRLLSTMLAAWRKEFGAAQLRAVPDAGFGRPQRTIRGLPSESRTLWMQLRWDASFRVSPA